MARPPAALQHPGVDPRAVVAHPQPQLLPPIGQLELDVRRVGGMKRVDERLPPDPVQFLPHHDVEGALPALDDDAQLRASVLGELTPGVPEGVHDLETVAVPGPQALDQAPALAHRAVRTIEGLVHQRPRRIGRGDPVGDGLELEDDAVERLEKCVVHFARDPLPLRKPGFHPALRGCRHLPHAQQIEHPEDGEGDRHDPRSKPNGLVVSGSDDKIHGGAGLVPGAVVVRSQDAEPVGAGGQIVVEGLPSRPRLLPVRILALELVPEPRLLGHDEAGCRVVHLDLARQRGKLQGVPCLVRPPVGDDLLDVHGRGPAVERQMAGIDRLDENVVREPEPTVGRPCRRRLERGRCRLRPVEGVERLHRDRDAGVCGPPVELRPGDRYEAARRVQPQRLTIVPNQGEGVVAGKPLAGIEGPGGAALPSREPGRARGPHRAVGIHDEPANPPSRRARRRRQVLEGPATIPTQAAVAEAEPDPFARIGSQHSRARYRGSGNELLFVETADADESPARSRHLRPDVVIAIVGEGNDDPEGVTAMRSDREKAPAFICKEAVVHADPQPPVTILEEGRDVGPGKAFVSRHGRDGPTPQDVERTQVSDPDGAVGGRQHRADAIAGQTFPDREGHHPVVPQAVDPVRGDDPEAPLPILVQGADRIARQAVRAAEVVGTATRHPVQPLAGCPDPQRTVRVHEELNDAERAAIHARKRITYSTIPPRTAEDQERGR